MLEFAFPDEAVVPAQANGGLFLWFGIAVLAVFSLIFLALFARYFGLWIQCKMTRAGISFPNLVMMSIRKVNPTVIVRSKIMAVQAGLVEAYPSLTTRALEHGAGPGGGSSGSGPGEPSSSSAGMSPLLVDWYDAASGLVDIRFDPACGATDHVVYSGALSSVSSMAWDLADCAAGTSGSATVDVGEGSRFFIIVGRDELAESSYGRDAQGVERPEAQGMATCDMPQELGGGCQ